EVAAGAFAALLATRHALVLAALFAAHALAAALAGHAARPRLVARAGGGAGAAGVVLLHVGAAAGATAAACLRHREGRPRHERRGGGRRQENSSHRCLLTVLPFWPPRVFIGDNARARAQFPARSRTKTPLVSRFRSSPEFAARSEAN